MENGRKTPKETRKSCRFLMKIYKIWTSKFVSDSAARFNLILLAIKGINIPQVWVVDVTIIAFTRIAVVKEPWESYDFIMWTTYFLCVGQYIFCVHCYLLIQLFYKHVPSICNIPSPSSTAQQQLAGLGLPYSWATPSLHLRQSLLFLPLVLSL